MATIYVDSNATGANDGTSWADAYTSIASTTGAAAGDDILIAHDHDETSSSFALNWSNATINSPVRILSVNSGTGALQAGAKIRTTAANSTHNIVLTGNVIAEGLVLEMANNLTVTATASGAGRYTYRNCTFRQNFDRGGSGSVWLFGPNNTGQHKVDLINCTFDRSVRSSWEASGGAIQFSRTTILRIANCTVVPAASTNGTFIAAINSNNSSLVEITDTDLSAFATPIELRSITAKLNRCAVSSSFSVTRGNAQTGDTCLLSACANGTVSVPALGMTSWDTYFGTAKSTLAVYRTGGATDDLQANAYSWEMSSTANAIERYSYLESPPITRWADPDSSISGATAQGIYTSTRCAPLATPTNLDADGTSTWNGSGVGTKQKIDVVLTNGDTLTIYVASGTTLTNAEFWMEVSEPDQVGGPVSVRCFLAKPSTTVYIDPVVYINAAASGRSYMTEGVQVFEPEGSGGTPDYPAEGDVRDGVSYDNANLTGTLALPSEADVRSSVQYGEDGTEFTGTLDPGGGGNTYSRGRLVNA